MSTSNTTSALHTSVKLSKRRPVGVYIAENTIATASKDSPKSSKIEIEPEQKAQC